MPRTIQEQIVQLEQVIAAQENLRAVIGDAAVDAAISALRKQIADLKSSLSAQEAISDTKPVEEMESQGDRRLATVMFVDVSGFTTMSEAMDPEHVRNLLNACFDQLSPIVTRYEGTINRYIGDAILALFGAPTAHENDPERAVRTALEMMDTLVEFNKAHSTSIGIHIGINTGLVVAGNIGFREHQEYSVWVMRQILPHGWRSFLSAGRYS